MNSVANSFIKNISNNKAKPILIQCVMWVTLVLFILLVSLSWAAYVLIKNNSDKKELISVLLLTAGSLNLCMVIYLLLYIVFLFRYKIGPGGIIGEYNMTLQYNNNHIGDNMWLLFFFGLNVFSSGLLFAGWTYKDDNTRGSGNKLCLQLVTAAASVATITIGGWLLYYAYLGIGCRTYEMAEMLRELNRTSPDIVRISKDWEKILKRKGEYMSIDLYEEFKVIVS